jgi:hypothetical protein
VDIFQKASAGFKTRNTKSLKMYIREHPFFASPKIHPLEI